MFDRHGASAIPHSANFSPFGPVAPEVVQLRGIMGLPTTASSYDRGEEIYGEGEPADYLYRVTSGAVRTYKLLSDGRRQIDAFHLPGDTFGFNAGDTHVLTAEAVVDTVVGVVTHRALESAAKTDAKIACEMWRTTAQELRHAQDHMLLLGRKNALERVVAFLMDMDRRLSVVGLMALPMCRRDIGDYLGLTLETVSRSLSSLAEMNLIGLSGARQITLRDRARLRAMTE